MSLARADHLNDSDKPRLGPRERSAIISWAAFTATFALVRAVTWAVRSRSTPSRDLVAAGTHLHHYLWGIALLAFSGGVAIHGREATRDHVLVAAGFGAGGALVVDEFALLVHFKDVYWSERGRGSVILGMGLIGLVGSSFPLAWLAHRVRRPT